MLNQSTPLASPESYTPRMCGCWSPAASSDLALEALGAERGGELGVQHFERNGAPVLEVARAEDGCHPAATDFLLDDVPSGEAVAKLRDLVRHIAWVGGTNHVIRCNKPSRTAML